MAESPPACDVVTYPSPAYLDSHARELFYLGHDLRLVCAPVRGDVAFSGEGITAGDDGDEGRAMRHAVIHACLLEMLTDCGGVGRRHAEVERRSAAEIVERTGIQAPALHPSGFREIIVGPEIPLPTEHHASSTTRE